MMNDLLSQYTKDEILNAIEAVCDSCTKQQIKSFCEMVRLRQGEQKSDEILKQVEQTKQAYLSERDRLIKKYGGIDDIPSNEIMHLCILQNNFRTALLRE